jgi:hypothetical protein
MSILSLELMIYPENGNLKTSASKTNLIIQMFRERIDREEKYNV